MNRAFEFYKNEFVKHSELADNYLVRAYYATSPFARSIALCYSDKEIVESLKALIQANKALGDTENNIYWQQKIEKIHSKYSTQREVLFYES